MPGKEAATETEITGPERPSLKPSISKSKQRPREYGVLEEDIFAIRIINTINYRQVKLQINKNYTIADIHSAYTPYEAHPEYYLWTDMHGKTLELEKTIVENGLVEADEVVEFDGIGKEPCILLVFKDGFENEPPKTLNPFNRYPAPGDISEQLCRNY